MVPADYKAIREENIRRYGEDTAHLDLLEQLYSKRTHFIYELIQNAEDARATELTFELFEDRLEVRHDGRPFTEDDVRSICGVGKSTKLDDLTQIGKFGIGFKSVYAYTRTPRVHCGDEHFRIENHVRPFAEQAKDVPAGVTLFVFPFDRVDLAAGLAAEEVSEALDGLDLKTLLFLRNIEHLYICGTATRRGSLGRGVDPRTATSRRVTLTNSSSDGLVKETWGVWERTVRNSEGEAHRVEIAFQAVQDERGEQLVACTSSPLVVFFPTEKETYLGFLAHGPYRTTPARDNIPQHDPWNKVLVDQTALLLVDVLIELRDAGLLSIEVLRAMPLNASRFGAETMFGPLFESVREAFMREKLIPLFGGGYGAAADVKLAPSAQLRELLSPAQLMELYALPRSATFVHESITERRAPDIWLYLREKLDVGEVTAEAVLGKTTRDFLSGQSDEWLIRFYGFLYQNQSLWKKGHYDRQPRPVYLKPIIRLENGRHVRPYKEKDKPNAYLPGPDATEFSIVRRAVASASDAREFLEALGLKKPDIAAEVLEYVLPRYEGGNVENLDWARHEADLDTIAKALSGTSGERREHLRRQLQRTEFLFGENADTGARSLRRPASLYLRTVELETYFQGNGDVWFVSSDYQSHAFLLDLGVREKVWVNAGKADWRGNVVTIEEHGNHERGLDRFDPNARIDGLQHALNHPTTARSEYVWNNLLIPNKHLIVGAVEYATRRDYTGSRIETQKSLIGEVATTASWLPDVDGGFRVPGELRLDDLPENYRRDEALAKALEMVQPVIEEASRQLGISADLLRALQDNPDLLEKLEKDVQALRYAATGNRVADPTHGDNSSHSFDYIDELSDAFQRPAATAGKGDKDPLPTTVGQVGNPELRRERVQESIKDDMATEPAARERFRRIDRRVWEARDSTVKHFLLEQYRGRCQICDDAFDKYDRTPYFEGLYLVSRLRARWINRPGNMLCLCASCCAKLQYGTLDGPDVVEQVRNWRAAAEGGGPAALSLTLCGEPVRLRFTERHLLELQAIIDSVTSSAETPSQEPANR